MTNPSEVKTQDKPRQVVDKKNSDGSIALSLFGSHAGGILIAAIMCLSLSFLMSEALFQLLAQLLVLLGYSFPIYSMMWTIGHRDLNRYSFGHTQRDIYRGFKLGALASIPVVVLSIAFIVIAVAGFSWSDFAGPIFRVLNSHVWPLLNLIELKALIADYSWWQLTLFAVLPVMLLVGVSGASYVMGNYDFSPMEKLMYKNKSKSKKNVKKKEKTNRYDTV